MSNNDCMYILYSTVLHVLMCKYCKYLSLHMWDKFAGNTTETQETAINLENSFKLTKVTNEIK